MNASTGRRRVHRASPLHVEAVTPTVGAVGRRHGGVRFQRLPGDQLLEGKRSNAFAIRYQVPDRTLTGEDANREQAKIVKRLEREFGAELRG